MRAIFLVGLPASGKTTWRETNSSDAYVASSDDFIEAMAKHTGKTYNEVFQDSIKPATSHFNAMITMAAIRNDRDLILDRTHTTVQSRKSVIDKIPFDWEKVAIVFKCFDFEVWKKRLMGRPGKLIPASVITDMMMKFEKPSLSEGFDRVVEYYT